MRGRTGKIRLKKEGKVLEKLIMPKRCHTFYSVGWRIVTNISDSGETRKLIFFDLRLCHQLDVASWFHNTTSCKVVL
jgi:hypothetical protein